jgi:hypothetical protein
MVSLGLAFLACIFFGFVLKSPMHLFFGLILLIVLVGGGIFLVLPFLQ